MVDREQDIKGDSHVHAIVTRTVTTAQVIRDITESVPERVVSK